MGKKTSKGGLGTVIDTILKKREKNSILCGVNEENNSAFTGRLKRVKRIGETYCLVLEDAVRVDGSTASVSHSPTYVVPLTPSRNYSFSVSLREHEEEVKNCLGPLSKVGKYISQSRGVRYNN